MTGSDVYRAISKVTKELSGSGITKRHTNEDEGYKYRSIDDLLNRLAPVLAKHKLCILPRVLEREAAELNGFAAERMASVVLRVAFDLISANDGSKHTIEVCGEALDAGDKATAKAMSAALKSAMVQAFCIPVVNLEDADASSPRAARSPRAHVPEPAEGWEAWTHGITSIVTLCESDEALRRLQDTYRDTLKGLSRERRELYDSLGAAFAARASALAKDQTTPPPPRSLATQGSCLSRNVPVERKDLTDA